MKTSHSGLVLKHKVRLHVRRRITDCVAPAVMLFGVAFAPAQAPSVDRSAKAIAAEVDAFFEDLALASVSVSVVQGDEITWRYARGKANIETDTDASTRHLYILGSVSKLFTAASFMKLHEQGKVGLDDDVSDHLPFAVRNPQHPGSPITFRMLLTHTSSLAYNRKVQDSHYGLGDPEMTLAQLVAKVFSPDDNINRSDSYLDHEPGSTFVYSNWNYVLLGYAVEHISKQLFHEFNRATILGPLEMKTAGWFIRDVEEPNIAMLYRQEKSGKAPVEHFGWPGYPDGQLRSSVEEASNFLIMVLNNGRFRGEQVLEERTITEILRHQKVGGRPRGSHLDMSLTWHVYELPGVDGHVYMHTGGPTASAMCMAFNPKTKSGFVSAFTGLAGHSRRTGDQLQAIFGKLLAFSAGSRAARVK